MGHEVNLVDCDQYFIKFNRKKWNKNIGMHCVVRASTFQRTNINNKKREYFL